jgi:hypothetical protein
MVKNDSAGAGGSPQPTVAFFLREFFFMSRNCDLSPETRQFPVPLLSISGSCLGPTPPDAWERASRIQSYLVDRADRMTVGPCHIWKRGVFWFQNQFRIPPQVEKDGQKATFFTPIFDEAFLNRPQAETYFSVLSA